MKRAEELAGAIYESIDYDERISIFNFDEEKVYKLIVNKLFIALVKNKN